VLIKWLRFCYGEDQSFAYDECCAAISVMFQLQLKCMNELFAQFSSYLTDVSKNHNEIGVQLLFSCVEYDECRRKEPRIDRVIAHCLFTRDNIVTKYDLIVNQCLLKLPADYLDFVEYGKPHTEYSEFSIRARYVEDQRYKPSLTLEEKRSIMEKVRGTELNSEEMRKLHSMMIFNSDEQLDRCLSALSVAESRAERLKNSV